LNDKKKLSEKDINDWKEFLKDNQKIFNKDINTIEQNNQYKFRFDFHGYSIEQANKKISEIIPQCYEKGISEILIITGKGKHSKTEGDVYVSKDYGKLSGAIPNYIKNNPDLMSKIISIKIADENMGGKGAIILKLKRLKNKF